MSKPKHKAESPAGEAAPPPMAVAKREKMPAPLLAAFLVVIGAGILLGATRERRTESGVLSAINQCDASVVAEQNGLQDNYGVVRFRYHSSEVARMLSLCETDPPLALRIYRESLTSGTPSAKLVALYSAFFLTSRKQLEKDDFDRLVARMNPELEKDANLRKAAQRAVADLTIIEDVERAGRYEILPAELPAPAEKAPAHQIQTREEKFNRTEKKVLAVRWTSPDVANAWWAKHASKGKWDKDLQRFVIPGGAGDK